MSTQIASIPATNPKIKTVRRFETQDGQNHATLPDAKIHDCAITLEKSLVENGFIGTKALAIYIAKNFSTFQPILQRLAAAHGEKKKQSK